MNALSYAEKKWRPPQPQSGHQSDNNYTHRILCDSGWKGKAYVFGFGRLPRGVVGYGRQRVANGGQLWGEVIAQSAVRKAEARPLASGALP